MGNNKVAFIDQDPNGSDLKTEEDAINVFTENNLTGVEVKQNRSNPSNFETTN